MFKPNLDCIISSDLGKYDVYGKPTLSFKAKGRCAIITLQTAAKRSPVRQDTSPSRGAAQQLEADAVLLFPTDTAVEYDDIVEVLNIKLRVSGKFPRVSLSGQLDHYQVELMIWAGT